MTEEDMNEELKKKETTDLIPHRGISFNIHAPKKPWRATTTGPVLYI